MALKPWPWPNQEHCFHQPLKGITASILTFVSLASDPLCVSGMGRLPFFLERAAKNDFYSWLFSLLNVPKVF